MYLETKIEDGKLYERFTPTGEWLFICYEKLLDRYIELENKYNEFLETASTAQSIIDSNHRQ